MHESVTCSKFIESFKINNHNITHCNIARTAMQMHKTQSRPHYKLKLNAIAPVLCLTPRLHDTTGCPTVRMLLYHVHGY